MSRLNRILRIYKLVIPTGIANQLWPYSVVFYLYTCISVFSLWLLTTWRVRLGDQLGPLRMWITPYYSLFCHIMFSLSSSLYYCYLSSREVKLALYMFIATHLMACGWFILACSSMTASAGDPHTCGVDSWAMKMSMLDGSNRTLSM